MQAIFQSAPDGSPLLNVSEGEALKAVHTNVALVFGEEQAHMGGTLYVTTLRVVWMKPLDHLTAATAAAGRNSLDQNGFHHGHVLGYAVSFLSLAVHAISRDPEAYPLPCIYAQIETEEDGFEDDEDSEEEEKEDPGEERRDGMEIEQEGVETAAEAHATETGDRNVLNLSKVSEMRLIPADEAQVEPIFRSLSECAALNPDPDGEREGEGEWFYNEEEVAEGLSRGNPHDLVVDEDENRFEDADEDDKDSPVQGTILGNGAHK